ncbi:MAG TPA: hypothetical protein DIV98_06815 [Oceanicaulis sp.]|nr:hypothetical protein [Oceanicaulis sp.]HCR94635.1 hypothetical protein [Oceanicaulis sp.]
MRSDVLTEWKTCQRARRFQLSKLET